MTFLQLGFTGDAEDGYTMVLQEPPASLPPPAPTTPSDLFVNVKDFGAIGDGVADDTAAFQAAINAAQTSSLRTVFIPAHEPSAYYKLGGAELVITQPIAIVGEHPLVTVGNKAGGLGGSQYLFNVNGTAFPNYEQFQLKNLSLRPDIGGTRCRGILLSRVAYPVLSDVIVTNGVTGIEVIGNRGYATHWERVRVNGCTAQGMVFAGFTGGGQHNFVGCAWNGNVGGGFLLTGDSVMSGVSFVGCAWEGNGGRPFLAQGDIFGMQFTGCYAEKNTEVGGYTIGFVPAAGKVQQAININGGIWETDAENWPFLFGGPGEIRAFTVTGTTTDGYATALVHTGAPSRVKGGIIQANYLQNLTAVVSGGPFTRTLIQNNENAAGAVA